MRVAHHLALGAVLVGAFACKPDPPPDFVADGTVRDETAIERSYQADLQRLEELKAELEKHLSIFESLKADARRDDLGEVIKGERTATSQEEILASAKRLQNLAASGLRNREVVRTVSGAERGYQDYADFATEILKRFGQ